MEPSLPALAALAIAALAGAAVQAATGFGFAILAAPVFLVVLASVEAVPLLAVLHLVQSAMLVPRVLPEVPRPELWRLLAGAAAGCPLGLLLLASLDVRALKLAAGLVILAVVPVMIRRSLQMSALPTAAATAPGMAPSVATGAVAGALTALLVMPGPPLMLWLMRWPLPPPTARALSLTFFAACYTAVSLMSLAAGALGPGSWRLAGLLALPVIAGTIAGHGIGPRLPARHFAAVLHGLLILAGLGAIASAL